MSAVKDQELNESNAQQPKDAEPLYDFEFITQALGLIPINGGNAAINPGAVVTIWRNEQDSSQFILGLSDDHEYTLDTEDMAELEETIKQRAVGASLIQKEAMKNQLRVQAEAMAELQGGVQPGSMIVGPAPTGRRFRQ